MYAGFITTRRVVKRAGIHQRFDTAAYKMITPFVPPEQFPSLKQILHFEGYNGPDGLKSKSGLKYRTKADPNPSHLYDPLTDTGEVPLHIEHHYHGLVEALKADDPIRAAFEASWMAHYVADGLTPAHHFPLEDKVAAAAAKAASDVSSGDVTRFTALLKKNWAIWGAKGHMSTHFNFEMGVAFALLLFSIHPEFDELEFYRAKKLGPIAYFKSEARDIAELDLYGRFYASGWTADLAAIVKNQLAPKVARVIGIIWLLALLDADRQLVILAQAQSLV